MPSSPSRKRNAGSDRALLAVGAHRPIPAFRFPLPRFPLPRFPLLRAAATHPEITFAADFAMVDAAEGKPRAFTVQAYNGGPLRVKGYDRPIVIDLATLKRGKTINANLDHDPLKRVGHVSGYENDQRTLKLDGALSAATVHAKEFADSHDNGFTWNASIEAKPGTVQEIAAGQSVTVNGQTFQGPIYVGRHYTLFGLAFLSRGADDNTTVSLAASAAEFPQESAMKFEDWVLAMAFDVATLTDKQKAALQAKYDAEVKAAAGAGGNGNPGSGAKGGALPEVQAAEFDLEEVKATYSELLSEFELVFATHEDEVTDKKKLSTIKAAAWKEAKELKVKALAEKWPATRLEIEGIRSKSKFELQLVQAGAPTGPAIHSSVKDQSPGVLEAALAIASGMPNIEKHFEAKTLETAHKQHRRISLQETILMCAAANGYQTRPGERIHRGNMNTIMRYAMPPVDVEGAYSSLSLPGILSNNANKELREGFQMEDPAWREIAGIRSCSDFKQVTSYRMLDDMEYEEVGPTGEIKHGKLDQESYTRQVKTYAKMFSLSRQDIINDDLGAFDDLRRRVGAGAARKLRKVFWTKFLDNSAFFTSGLANYITGSTTTLLVDGVGLQLAINAFMKLVDSLGTRVGGRASILLVPPELQFAADRLYQSTNVNTGGAATAESVGNANIHANKYRPVCAVELSDSTYTGYSTTAWYLLRDPAILPAVVVSFLDGVQFPTVESNEASFNTLGIEIRGYHDFGCDQAENLCGVKSKGAA